MGQHNKSLRVVILSLILVIAIGLFVLNLSNKTPVSKNDSLPEIKQNYIQIPNEFAFSKAVKLSQAMIMQKETQGLGYLWLGKCYDAMHQQLVSHKQQRDLYQQRTNEEFYPKEQRQNYNNLSLAAEDFLKKWDYEKNIDEYLRLALQNYEKALEFEDSSSIISEILQQHFIANRITQALELAQRKKLLQQNNISLQFFISSLLYLNFLQDQSTQKPAYDFVKKTIAHYNTLSLEQQKSFQKRIAQCYFIISKVSQDSEEVSLAIEKAAELSPEDEQIQYNYVELLTQQKKYHLAQTQIMRLEKLKETPQICYLQAKLNSVLWNRQLALNSLMKAIFLDRGNPECYVYKKMQEDEVWKKFYKDPQFLLINHLELPLAKENHLAFVSALYFAMEKDFDRSATALQLLPKSNVYGIIGLHNALGKKMYVQEVQKEVERYKELSQKDPKQTRVRKYVEQREQELQKFDLQKINDEIEQYHEIALENISENSRIVILYCYFRWKQFDKAVKLLEEWMPHLLNPDIRAFALYIKATYLKEQNQVQESLGVYESCIQLTPNNPAYLFLAADLHIGQQQFEAATQKYTKSLDIIDLAEIRYRLGKAYIEQNKNNLAIEHLKQCYQLKPSMYLAQYELAKLYLQQNDMDKALESLELSLQQGTPQHILQLLRQDTIWKKCVKEGKFLKLLMKYQEE